jgi:hypothetical protein
MATNARNRLLKELQSRSIKEALEGLPYITEVFRAKGYDLNKVVANELDFLLGAVFSHIINQYIFSCYNRGIWPSPTETTEFNVSLFSKALEFRNEIKKFVRL